MEMQKPVAIIVVVLVIVGVVALIFLVTSKANAKPIAKAGEDRTVNVGDTVIFDGGKSYDPDNPDKKLENYSWNFGDGSLGYGVNVSHVYTTSGKKIVTLTVRDDKGADNSDDVNITVNALPVANMGSDRSIRIGVGGTEVTFNGNASADPDGQIVNYTWNFGDGSMGYSMVEKHVYRHGGLFLVSLTVRDNLGATNMASITLTAKDIALKVDSIQTYQNTTDLNYYADVTVSITNNGSEPKNSGVRVVVESSNQQTGGHIDTKELLITSIIGNNGNILPNQILKELRIANSPATTTLKIKLYWNDGSAELLMDELTRTVTPSPTTG